MDLDHDHIIDVCPCCGSPFDNQKISICVKHNQLDFLGPGFPLFYEFLIFCVLCIFLLFCIQGIYGLSTNPDGEACHLANLSKTKERPCTENGINRYSWFNKVERDDVQSGLNLFGAFALLIILNIFKFRHKNVEIRLDNNNTSPSDYTIQISELPVTEKEEEIKEFFENCIPNKQITISKICMAYYVEEYVNLKNQKQKLVSKQSNLLSDIMHSAKKHKNNEHQQALHERKNIIEAELVTVQEKIEKFEKECEINVAEKFCGVVYLSLQNEEDHKALLEYWQLSFFQIIIVMIMSRLFKKQARTYKGKLISVVRSPEPTDVIWENLGYSPLYRFKAIIMTNMGTFLTLCVCAAAIFGINYAQAFLAEEANTDKSKSSLVQGFGILAAVLVLFVNFFLQMIVKKLVKLRYIF